MHHERMPKALGDGARTGVILMKFIATPSRTKSKAATNYKEAERRQIWKRVLSDRLSDREPARQAHWSRIIAKNWLGGNLAETDVICTKLANECYRPLSPLAATELFARNLREELKMLGIGFAEMGLEKGFESANIEVAEAIWRARQTADMLGMKYDRYIDAIITAHFESGMDEIGLHSFSGTEAASIARYRLVGTTEGMPLPVGTLKLDRLH